MRKVNQLQRRKLSTTADEYNDVFTNKLPLDVTTILSKYDKRYILNNNYYTVQYVPYRRIVNKNKERNIKARENIDDIEVFKNLQTVWIEGVECFNFSSIRESTIEKLKLLNIKEMEFVDKMDLFFDRGEEGNEDNDDGIIVPIDITKMYEKNKIKKYKYYRDSLGGYNNLFPFNLKRIHLENVNISDEQLKILFSAPIQKLKIVHCKIENLPSTTIPYISLINCGIKITEIKIKKYKYLHYKEKDTVFFYSNEVTKKCRLKLKNCYEYFYDDLIERNIFEDVEVLTIENGNVQKLPPLPRVISISIINSALNHNLLKFSRELEKICFRRTEISFSSIYNIVDRYRNSLKFVDLSHIELPLDFLNQIKSKLNRCKVIYKDMIMLNL
ncbi:hypothetical protein SLOPH_703 [Spraguea lophii 42_110]|uniref:Uncharacterized protein n=1 Tax=Spraguea lophii (strain 42_110) TaxID=1358809 RepID=S7XUR8_SPRLO|nr:hypothetical protein SLOPH_703 [Spraguea lophii 42_110]